VPDIEAITAEMVDRFGPVPPLVDTLLRVMELRRWLKDARVLRARRRGDAIVLEFDASTPVAAQALVDFVRSVKGRARMSGPSSLEIRPQATDHDGLIAELRAHLQKLATA
jgi:transcription-repair coupling factor (superfamily II helicase)